MCFFSTNIPLLLKCTLFSLYYSICAFIFKVLISWLKHWFYLGKAFQIVGLDLWLSDHLQFNCDLKTWSSMLLMLTTASVCSSHLNFSFFCTNKQILLNVVVWRCETLWSFAWHPLCPVLHQSWPILTCIMHLGNLLSLYSYSCPQPLSRHGGECSKELRKKMTIVTLF